MHLGAYSRSRVASATADDRQARLQRLRSCVRRLQDSGASSGLPHSALHSLVINNRSAIQSRLDGLFLESICAPSQHNNPFRWIWAKLATEYQRKDSHTSMQCFLGCIFFFLLSMQCHYNVRTTLIQNGMNSGNTS